MQMIKRNKKERNSWSSRAKTIESDHGIDDRIFRQHPGIVRCVYDMSFRSQNDIIIIVISDAAAAFGFARSLNKGSLGSLGAAANSAKT